jgi:signal transduction histidine kinase
MGSDGEPSAGIEGTVLEDASPLSGLAKVWIVDDSPLEANACRAALRGRFDVTVYSKGTEALEALAMMGAPSVMVLDWNMPDLSGEEVCTFIRSRLDLAQLPILVLTGTGTTEALFEAMKSGANDFVQKPFSPPELISRVTTLAQVSSLHGKLAQARAALRDEAAFRDKFMGILAHDLRQPLNTIGMASQLLIAGATPAQLKALPEMQFRAVLRMQRMILELLDFTRYRPDSDLPIVRERQALADIAAQSVQEIELAHPGRSLRHTVTGDTTGKWDADRLAQVLSNLISNALEHGSSAPVDVTVTGAADEVEVRVTNQGPPISPETAAELFKPFRQGRGASSKRTGVGLGLHIASTIVMAHGGSLQAVSDDAGTHLIVRLPRR